MKVERFDCPIDYLKLVLARLTSAFVNKVGEGPHWRPPVWKGSARQISWKCFELDEVKALFQSSSTPLALNKSFNGGREVADTRLALSGVSAIALAKAKARGASDTNQQPTCCASLVVGKGEGRATREFEVIWWPDMYQDQRRGKLTLRFYVGKVHYTN